MSTKDQGLENLRGSMLSWCDGLLDSIREEAVGDSPIEKLLLSAIHIYGIVGRPEYRDVISVETREEEVSLRDKGGSFRGRPFLLLRRQAILGTIDASIDSPTWRVDFLIQAFDYHSDKWRVLIVECDGHDFHERTKEQALRDRGRDRWAEMKGFSLFRFTGSEIFNNSWECARQIFDWAAQGL